VPGVAVTVVEVVAVGEVTVTVTTEEVEVG
jgi:hypothetical protein